ncbi:SusC/RagA family TonB-linked outer membrane protein [Flavobacterium sp. FlaQc-47]|uniref:SusC/RagA family TonB-linked outer membrane protein n=1 Tax=Flavobacterium sp. FlaQc-47 TaxID=3374180 RepID=UPI0037571EC5
MITGGHAQQTFVTGKVTDAAGLPMPGTNITLHNSNLRASTDDKGNFSIAVEDAKTAVLTFFFIGFLPQIVNVNGQASLNITMSEDAQALKEVVVTALNINRKSKSLGYSRQGVNVDEMTQATDPNIANLLAGKVAGLQVTTSGQSTGSTRVVIRGINSLTGNNQPLWVVDGVPIENGDGQNGNLDYGNGAANLNPNDIENIEVLKGPNAAALYGSRAANGAILVTSKKGKATGKYFGISVNSNVMMQSISQFPAYQNVYGEGSNGRLASTSLNSLDPVLGVVRMGTNNVSFGAPMLGQPFATYAGTLKTYDPQPNNISDLYQTALTSTQNIAFDKSDKTSTFRLSYTLTTSDDVIYKQNVRTKQNIAINSSKEFKSYFKLDTRLQYTNDIVKNRVFRNMDINSPMNSHIYLTRSTAVSDMLPWADENGNAFNSTNNNSLENPYWLMNENYNEDRSNRFIGAITATLGIFPGLKFRGQIAPDMTFGNGFVYIERGGTKNRFGNYRNFTTSNQTWNTEGLFMYNQKFNQFSLIANLGGNLRSSRNYGTASSIASLAEQNKMTISNTSGIAFTQENLLRYQVNSVYATATLGYQDFLFLDLTARNDWSSALSKENRSFFYPSVSVSFVFTDKFKVPGVDFGKIRTSFAQVGNDPNPYSLYSNFNNVGSFLGIAMADFDDIYRKNSLKPEITTSSEVGIELKFLKGRLSFDGTAYVSTSKNQLFQSQQARETGFTSFLVNAGEIYNEGVELSLNAAVVKTKDFSWNLLANWSKNTNKVIELSDGIQRLQMGGTLGMTVNAEVGQPIGTLRGNDTYHASTGEIIINPSNGRTYFDQDVYLGSFLPKWLASLGSTIKYKNFDLNLNFNMRWGGQMYSASNHKANQSGNTIASLQGRDEQLYSSLVLGESGDELKGYTQIGGYPYPDANRAKGVVTEGNYPLLDSKGQIVYDANGRIMPGEKAQFWTNPQTYWNFMDSRNSFNIFDSSFIKLNQVILGYTLPTKWLNKKTFFQNARISLVGRNLWTIYSKTPRGIDPESSNTTGNAQGIESGGSLPYATYGVDFKLSF